MKKKNKVEFDGISCIIAIITIISFIIFFSYIHENSNKKMNDYCKEKGYDLATDGYAYPFNVICSNVTEEFRNGKAVKVYINSKRFKEEVK